MSSTEAGTLWHHPIPGVPPEPPKDLKYLTPRAIGAKLPKGVFVEIKDKVSFPERPRYTGETRCTIEGRKFRRYNYEKFFRASELNALVYPEIVCPCGCTAFQASYGSYELLLKCLACGTEDCVYSG